MGVAPNIPTSLTKELSAFNPRLRVRWDHERNVFVIEERGRTDGNWYYVFIWADKIGLADYRFRPLPQTAGPIIERLVEMDLARFQRTPRAAWKALMDQLDSGRKEFLQAILSKQKDDTQQSIKEKWSYFMKGKRTFDMGRAQGEANAAVASD